MRTIAPVIRSSRLAACSAGLSLLSIASLCAAAEPLDAAGSQLRPIVVTSSREPATLGSEVAATSVITREDIERTGVRDLVSALELLATVQVEQLGGPGTTAAARIRGGDTRDTLLLIDGVPLTDVTSGQASISQIPIDDIERIEVVRGNVSALYGANATGGVIQVFTRRGEAGMHAQLEMGAGNRRTRSWHAALSGGSRQLQARLGLGGSSSRGFSAGDPSISSTTDPDDDGYRRRDFTLALDALPAPGQRIGLDVREFAGHADYDDPSSFGAPADTHVTHWAQRGATLRGSHELAGPDWRLAWRLGRTEEHRSDDTVTAFGPSNFGNALRNDDLAADLTGKLSGGWSLQLGAEHLKQSTSNATYLVQERTTDSVRAGATYHAGWGSLQANVRHDRADGFGSATTGLLGGTWRLGSGFSAVGNVATSFTPPTLDFLYFDCSSFGLVCSNPQLVPEKSRSADLGVQWEAQNVLLRATFFAARYRNKIVNDANGVPQNVDRARDQGVELSGRASFGPWRVTGEGMIHHPENEATGALLPRRSRTQWAARVDRELPRGWSVGGGLKFVGDRKDTAGQDLPGYTLLDLSARWSITREWSLQAAVRNALDRRYQPAAGYRGTPRGVFVSLSWRPV